MSTYLLYIIYENPSQNKRLIPNGSFQLTAKKRAAFHSFIRRLLTTLNYLKL